MSLEIIGAGLPRTGTESLKNALEMLGYERCYHMVELIRHPEHLPLWEAAADGEDVDFDVLFDGYRAAVDFPAMQHWQALSRRYPQARVILTVRDARAWHTSLTNTILSVVGQLPENDPATTRRRRLVKRCLVDGLLEGRTDEPEFMRTLFERHHRNVVESIADDRLLVFDVRDGWGPLCSFLGRSVPSSEFPRVNSSADFRRNYLKQEY